MNPLVPCGYNPTGVTDFLTATNCNLCSFGQLIQNIINFLIGISFPIAAVMFMWAGILYFTAGGDTRRIERGKRIFKDVLIGFLIALSGWLIVQTALSLLVNRTFWFAGNWNTLQCTADDSRLRNATVGQIFGGLFVNNGTNTVTPSGTTGGASGGASADEVEARGYLASAGDGSITINAACEDGAANCRTQVGGVKQEVLGAVVRLQSDCAYAAGGSCPVVITGGNEAHPGTMYDPHAAGNAVDIRSSPSVDQQMRSYIGFSPTGSNPTPSTSGTGYPVTINGQNFQVYYEGNHWHIQLPRTGS